MTKYELNSGEDYETIRIDVEDMVEIRQLSNQIITRYGVCDLQTIQIVFEMLFENGFAHTLESYLIHFANFSLAASVGAFRC